MTTTGTVVLPLSREQKEGFLLKAEKTLIPVVPDAHGGWPACMQMASWRNGQLVVVSNECDDLLERLKQGEP